MSEYVKTEVACEAVCAICNEFAPPGTCSEECGWIGRFKEGATDVTSENWISVENRLPSVETEVLVVCDRNGYRFVCPAIYEDGTVLTQDSIWSWYELNNYGTYSEENDDYFIPKCWWENRQFTPDDVYNNPIDCPVTHWMPLPELPKCARMDGDAHAPD